MLILFKSALFGMVISATAPQVSVEKFLNDFKGTQIDLLENFYDKDAVFQDVFVDIKGRDAIRNYNIELFKKIKDIRYEIESHIVNGHEEALTWTMYVRHSNINKGEWVHEKGGTFVRRSKETNRVVFHRDYFDTGPVLYEGIPFLGWLVKLARKAVME